MTITILNLGNGQLPSSTGVLYTVPASASTNVKSIVLVNASTANTEQVNLYYVPSGGTKRHLIPLNWTLYPSVNGASSVLEVMQNLTMGAGDAISGDATNASTVDYVISGVQFT